jgi:hypothetical protein
MTQHCHSSVHFPGMAFHFLMEHQQPTLSEYSTEEMEIEELPE